MIMKLGNVNIDEGSNVLAKNRDSPRCNEGVIFLSTIKPTHNTESDLKGAQEQEQMLV